jgi:hypothetical protein
MPPSDAFYVFQGWLGERRRIPGRSGPPGADYNTLPAFKPKAVQLAAFYWREDDPDYLEVLGELFEAGRPREIDAQPLYARLLGDLESARPHMVACAPSEPQIGRVSPTRITQASSST